MAAPQVIPDGWEIEGEGPSVPDGWEIEGAASPSSGPPRRYVNPNRGKSGGQLAGEGARRFASDMLYGGAQLATRLPAMLGAPGAQERVDLIGNMAEKGKMDPAMRTTAGQVGYTGAALVPAVGAAFIPGANTLAGGAALGGVMGAMQPTGEGDSFIANTAGGAAFGLAGQGAANLLGRAAVPLRKALTPPQSRAVRVLQQADVPLSPAQQTGSLRAQQVERFLGDYPITQPQMLDAAAKRQLALTKAFVRTTGENADNLGPAVADRAAKRIGGVMDDIASKYDLDMTHPQLTREIADIEAEAGRLRTAAGDTRIQTQIDRIRALSANGKMDGKSYQSVRRELAKLSRDPDNGEYAYALNEALTDALQRSAGPDAKNLKTARSQWRNLQALMDVADPTENAQITGPALAQRLKKSNYTKNSFRYGRGDAELSRLARAASTVVDRTPQSGTTPRGLLQATLPAVAAGGGAVFGGETPEERALAAAKWGAAGYFGPKVLASAMTRPGGVNYLVGANQGLVRNALMLPSQAGTGALVPAYLLSQQ